MLTILLFLTFPFLGFAQKKTSSTGSSSQEAKTPVERFESYLNLIKEAKPDSTREGQKPPYFDQAKRIADSLGNDSLQFLLLAELGAFYSKGGDEISALKYFFEAVNLAEISKDSIGIVRMNYKIGAHYFWKEEYEKALGYFQSGINASPQNEKGRNGKALMEMALGATLQNLYRFEEAMIHHQKALAIKKEIKAWKDIPISLNNIADLHLSMGDTVQAILLLDEVISISDSLGQQDSRMYAESLMGGLLHHQKKYKASLEHLKVAEKWWEENDYGKDLLRAYPIISDNYEQLGEPKKAIASLKKLIALKEENYNKAKIESIQELEAKYQTEKKELENANLKQANEIVQARNKQYLIGTSVLGGVLLLLGLFFIQLRRAKRRLDVQNETIALQNEQLTELDRIKTNFFSNITHEFRTPLTLILEPLRQLLKEGVDVRIKERLQFAKNNSEKLLQLVNQLLDISKLEANKMSLDLRKGNVEETLLPIVQSFQTLADRKKINLRVRIADDIPEFYFDKQHLEKVFFNLMSNAIKFTDEGSVSVNIFMLGKNGMKNLDAVQKSLVIKVKDSGIGIDPKQIEQVFERFYQVDNSSTKKGQGTGIGLALSKELVLLMNGQIDLKSELGEGAEFTVSIPLDEGIRTEQITTVAPKENTTKNLYQHSMLLTDSVIVQSSKEKMVETQTEKQLILLVEDNTELRYFLKQSLESEYQVVEAVDGVEAIEKAKELIPDLIVSDLMMPRKDGFEVLKDLKNNVLTSHVPIVLLTAKSAIESKLKGLRFGADDYLTKPFNSEELLIRIANLIENRKRVQQKFQNSLTEKVVESAVEDKSLSDLDLAFIDKIKYQIESNLNKTDFTVDRLAHQMLMSNSKLFRKLKALTNQTPSVFIRNYRLDRGMEMLKQDGKTLMQLSSAVGFEDHKYFNKRFKERFGKSVKEVVAEA